MATIDIMLDELRTHLEALAEPLEGAIDYKQLNLSADAHIIAENGHQAFADERTRTLRAIEALEALSGGHFPHLPTFTVPAKVEDDFERNEKSIQAFRRQLRVEAEVVAGEIQFSDTQT